MYTEIDGIRLNHGVKMPLIIIIALEVLLLRHRVLLFSLFEKRCPQNKNDSSLCTYGARLRHGRLFKLNIEIE